MLLSIDLPVADYAGSRGDSNLITSDPEVAGRSFADVSRDFAAPTPVPSEVRSAGRRLPRPGKLLPQDPDVLEVEPSAAVTLSPAAGAIALEPFTDASIPFEVPAREGGGSADAGAKPVLSLAARSVVGGVMHLPESLAGVGTVAAPPVAPEGRVTPAAMRQTAAGQSPPGPGLAAFERSADSVGSPGGIPPVAAGHEPATAGLAAARVGGIELEAGPARLRQASPFEATALPADPAARRGEAAFRLLSPALIPPSFVPSDRAPETKIARQSEALTESLLGRLPGGSHSLATAPGPALPQPGAQASGPMGTAAATPLPAIMVPLQDPRFGQALGDRVFFMSARGIATAQIRLVPAELGPVTVSITVEDGTAELAFTAHHLQTREAIELALPRLREMLGEQGLALGHASVTDQGAWRDGRGPAADAPGHARGTDGEVSKPASGASDAIERATRGLIDTFA